MLHSDEHTERDSSIAGDASRGRAALEAVAAFFPLLVGNAVAKLTRTLLLLGVAGPPIKLEEAKP